MVHEEVRRMTEFQILVRYMHIHTLQCKSPAPNGCAENLGKFNFADLTDAGIVSSDGYNAGMAAVNYDILTNTI